MMQTPPDYPVDNTDAEAATDAADNAQITYRALRNRVLANQPVTDDMIKTALLKIECAQGGVDDTATTKSTLSTLKKRLRIRSNTQKQ